MYETARLAIALRMARAVAQMTQKELAVALDASKTVIARNEKPDMAMRADTLVRLIYVMRMRHIEIDLFNTLDTVKLSTTGSRLDAAAMRAARAALNLNQEQFAERIGLTKPVVTRGERPTGIMRAETMVTLVAAMAEEGIDLDWSPKDQVLSVTVKSKAVAAMDAIAEGKAPCTLSGETPSDPTIVQSGDR